MEIGGYRELDLRTGYEYYKGNQVARLNSGRAGIYHALRCCGCKKLLIPYYQCSSVGNFLTEHDITLIPYHIDRYFRPILEQEKIDEDTAVLIVNYFGLIPRGELIEFTHQYSKVIFDNTQAFYSKPIENAYNVYSPRKFFGVSDGCYVIGSHAQEGVDDYPVDMSAETASFLLRRIESGGNNNYALYLENEERIDKSDIRQMSRLTHALLDNIDYDFCIKKRRENFQIAHKLLGSINCIPVSLVDRIGENVPMVYPLVIEDSQLRIHLKRNQIFVGQWWKYLLSQMESSQIEYYYADYMIPIQIDQRYSDSHLIYTRDVIQKYLANKD